jgi:hypothetical protein
VLPPGISQKFVPARAAGQSVVYQPAVLGAVQIRYLEPKRKLDYVEDVVLAAPIRDDSMPVEWEECMEIDVDPSSLENDPVEGASFAQLPGDGAKAKCYAGWNKDLVNWIYTHRKIDLYSSDAADLTSHPGESEAAFRIRLQHATREARDTAVEKLRQKYASKVTTLQDRLRRSQQTLAKEKEQRSASFLSVGADIFGVVFGRKRATSAIGSVSRTYRESSDIGRAEENLEAVTRQLEDLQAQIESEAAEIQSQMDSSVAALETAPVKPKKANINVRLFTLAWLPYAKDAGGELKPAWE